MIPYKDFRRLWLAAHDIPDLDRYIAETGGSVPCDDTDRLISLLTLIHRLARSAASDVRAAAGLTQANMERLYGVPMSTVNKWDLGISNPSPWAHALLAYAVISDMLGANDEE